jgi:hypothetical protein
MVLFHNLDFVSMPNNTAPQANRSAGVHLKLTGTGQLFHISGA